ESESVDNPHSVHPLYCHCAHSVLVLRAMKKALLIGDEAPWSPDELKRWRHRVGLTQLETAVALGVSLRAIESWEGGKRTPSHPTLLRKQMRSIRPKKRGVA